MATDDNDGLDVWKIGRNCIKHWNEVGANNEHLGGRVVHDVCNLWWSKSPVDIDADRIEQAARIEHLEVIDAVLVQECNAVLRANASSLQCICNLARALVQLRPRLGLVALHKGNVGWLRGSVRADDACDVSNVIPHLGETSLYPNSTQERGHYL